MADDARGNLVQRHRRLCLRHNYESMRLSRRHKKGIFSSMYPTRRDAENAPHEDSKPSDRSNTHRYQPARTGTEWPASACRLDTLRVDPIECRAGCACAQ